MCTGGDPGGGSEKQASASAPPPESSAARAARLQRERAKAADIRAKAAARSVAGKSEAEIRASERRADYMSPKRSPGRGQSAASARATAQAKNRAAISELRGRMQEQPPGILGGIGQISLSQQIKALGQGAIPVQIKSDESGIPITVGTIGPTSKRYSGRPEYADIAREAVKKGGTITSIDTSLKEAMSRKYAKDDAARDPQPAAQTKKDEVAEVTQMGGSGVSTKNRRRGSGRRTAFGSRQSLINLRNVRP